jgi:glycerophosphoryl diester phosphodiesterase
MPENTLVSFELAIAEEACGIETDLRFTKDGQLVCFHDGSLTRMTDHRGRLADYTLDELKDVRVTHNTVSPQAIPTLEELLEWLPGGISIILELKDWKFKHEKWACKLIDAINHHGVVSRTILASFELGTILVAQRLNPAISTCFLTYSNLSPNQPAQLLSPLFPILWLNPTYVQEAHRNNKLVAPWDPWPHKRIGTYMRWGVDIVVSDDPGRTRRAIESTCESG